jgi:hypothetical protein
MRADGGRSAESIWNAGARPRDRFYKNCDLNHTFVSR